MRGSIVYENRFRNLINSGLDLSEITYFPSIPMSLDKLPNFCKLQFPHFQNKDNNIYFKIILSELNKIK